MKRMSEVLVRELPISSGELLHVMVNETSLEDDDAIAHAINHVDALADALEGLMDWHVKNVNAIHHPVYDRAAAILKAYRGAK